MALNDVFHGITTPIKSDFGSNRIGDGTGFFYQLFGKKPEDKPSEGLFWHEVEKTWLITNRHTLLSSNENNEKEIMTNKITFCMRRIHEGLLQWEPILVVQEELLKRARFHQDSSIDVCIISVQDLMTSRLSKGEDYLRWHSVSTETLSGKNNIHVEVADDILVVGYPHSYYDPVNLFPIVKSGIVASKWGAYFNGEPYFLIDAKLFPSSSGSIVVSKPTHMVVDGNNVYTSKEKQFAFLGIYSGIPDLRHPKTLEELDVDVGIVWYGHLVDEIIANGVPYQDT